MSDPGSATNGSTPPDAKSRAAARYALALETECSWKETDGTTRTIVGLTEEIGPHGATIVTQSPPPIGALVEVVVWIPTDGPPKAYSVRLRGKGTVVRSNADGFVAEVLFRVARGKGTTSAILASGSPT